MIFWPVRLAFKIVTVVVGAIILYFAITLVQVWLTSRNYDPKPADAIIVMGAAQYNGVPSPDLQARLDEAIKLYDQHLANLVVVTGSKEKGDVFTEAQAGEMYLALHGVLPTSVIEVGGGDSYENLADAASRLKPLGKTTVLIATDPFHEARSLGIASSVGLKAYPTPTKTSPIKGWSTFSYFFKETFDVGFGRIIGYHNLNTLHADLG